MKHAPALAAALALGVAAVAAPSAAARVAVPANPRAGVTPNRVAPGHALRLIAAGGLPLENPAASITRFGYLNDSPPQPVERTKTEPDENTYLVLPNPGGPTRGYRYGHHFLFQGHENGGGMAYITRINLDVRDPRHRVTLLSRPGASGTTGLSSIDGSTFDPSTRTLLFTQENGSDGGVIETSWRWPARAHTLYGIIGRAGYEGIHPDNRGRIYLVEDTGGTEVHVRPSDPASPEVAKQPNSFVYRFLPYDRRDLSGGGTLQALQVRVNGHVLRFHASDPVGDVFSADQLALHRLGSSWPARWVTVHDTRRDGHASFDANALAKAAGATPFKRPENGQFQPGSGFRSFVFDATGDTNADAGAVPALARRGTWGSIFRLRLDRRGDAGRLAIIVRGDAAHASFDNLAFAGPHTLLAAEDRGDTLHTQLNRLDSVWAYDLRRPGRPSRLIGLGRDPASAHDAALLDADTPGYQNEGDNEPTGLHVSSGRTTVAGMVGTLANLRGARWFLTQQHGLNRVWQIVRTHP